MIQTEGTPCNLPVEIQHSALLQLLTNSLILIHTTPYLSCYDVLNLAATSRAFRFLVYQTPQVFRRLELSNVRTAQFDIDAIDHGGESWRNNQVDENLTEDDFYSGPLRGIFSSLRRADILRDVQILSLDSLSVTAELIHDILIDSAFSVRILSIRGTKNLNERKLRGALQYACRESRAPGTPRLKGLYVFGPRDSLSDSPPGSSGSSPTPGGSSPISDVASSWNSRSQKALTESLVEEPEAWYARSGEQFPRRISPEWASTLVACDGVIAFDSVLCKGPRHINSPAWGSVNIDALNAAGSPASANVPHHAVATHSLLEGCAGCGSAPEGWTVWGEYSMTSQQDRYERRTSASHSADIGRFPLLAPPPMHSANIMAAMCPTGQQVKQRSFAAPALKHTKARFIPRCSDCLLERYCKGCYRWWCEACYIGPFALSSSNDEVISPNNSNVSPPHPSPSGVGAGPSRDVRVHHGLCVAGACRLRLGAET
ncbi:hypothetical protein B0T16DRAFT_333158 [Cercophora newfieldiana]|uniref:F-box domain-containing protein n=1 Tax=Cercophora newfieldiana TaxID=92897 RepID=A0AA39Y366_9PEZI|nr:hypothetical protein B0T16DRAFT_333158 [Cercophora newfieldiana]